jgi:hypothetical protein
VHVWWEEEGEWYAATIVRRTQSSDREAAYELLYDDGEEEDSVDIALLRLEYGGQLQPQQQQQQQQQRREQSGGDHGSSSGAAMIHRDVDVQQSLGKSEALLSLGSSGRKDALSSNKKPDAEDSKGNCPIAVYVDLSCLRENTACCPTRLAAVCS